MLPDALDEFSGAIPSFEIALALWLACLLPLAAAIYGVLAQRGDRAPDESKPKLHDTTVGSLIAAVAALALVGMNAFALITAPAEQRQLVSYAWTLLRIGSLDATFTASMTPATGLAAVVVLLAACGVLGWSLTSLAPTKDRMRFAVGVDLALAGMLWVLLGDDWVLMSAGALLTGIGGLVLGPADSELAVRGFVLGRAGDAAFVLAGAVLVWGLSGDWTGGGEYLPDFRPRVVPVQLGEPRAKPKSETSRMARGASGTLSMASLPGSTLVLGGATLCAVDADGKHGGVGTAGRPCREIAHSPFSRLELPVALQDIEITSGPGTNELEVDKARISAEQETLLTITGATLVPREMRDQLVIRDQYGGRPFRAGITKKKVLGQPLMGLVGALLALAVFFRGLVAAFAINARGSEKAEPGARAFLVGATELGVGAAILLRTDFLLDMVPRTALLLAVIAGVAMVVAAARAAHAASVETALTRIAVSELALVVLAFALGAHEGATALLAVHVLAVLGFAMSASAAGAGGSFDALGGRTKSSPRAARANATAALAIAGAPVPAVGVFWGRDAALQIGAAVESLGFMGWLAAALGLLGAGVLSFAAWRAHHLIFSGTAATPPEKLAAPSWFLTATMAASLLGLAIGALAIAGHVLEGVPTPLETWLRPLDARDVHLLPDHSVRLAIVVVSYAVATAGWAVARARYGAARAKDWSKREATRPLASWLAGEPREWLGSLLGGPVSKLAARFDEVDLVIESIAFTSVRARAEEQSSTKEGSS